MKFRGKRVKDDKWIYGYLAEYKFHIINDVFEEKKVIFKNVANFATDNVGFVAQDCEVAPNTIGQYIGGYDTNGYGIYEGDIVRFEKYLGVVSYNSKLASYIISLTGKGFYIPIMYRRVSLDDEVRYDLEIIGNKWDNPELLEESEV